MGLVIKTAPAEEPVTLTELKAQLRIDGSTEDAILAIYLQAAREWAESYTRRAFITQTWTLWLDNFPFGRSPKWWDGVVDAHINTLNEGARDIVLPRPKLQSVTHLKTYGDDNTATTFTGYIVDAASESGRIVLKNSETWPTNLRAGNAIEIEFVCGYGAAAAVPMAIKTAILQVATKLYECRGDMAESDFPTTAKLLLNPYKVLVADVLNPQMRRL